MQEVQGRYLVFGAKDVEILRRHHRITGVLSGTLQPIPQQNIFMGLPLELMTEEVALLLAGRHAVLQGADQCRNIPAEHAIVHKLPEYSLFTHLHQHGYYLSPGLRFGAHYLVYPGDPVRFHSHFSAIQYEWDDEIDLVDLVGGGRLGTGVKKGWMLGGRDTLSGNTYCFCIEWSGFG